MTTVQSSGVRNRHVASVSVRCLSQIAARGGSSTLFRWVQRRSLAGEASAGSARLRLHILWGRRTYIKVEGRCKYLFLIEGAPGGEQDIVHGRSSGLFPFLRHRRQRLLCAAHPASGIVFPIHARPEPGAIEPFSQLAGSPAQGLMAKQRAGELLLRLFDGSGIPCCLRSSTVLS